MAVVLVTGGAGYIGSHACKKLKADGHIPVTFDNFSTGWRDAVKFGPFVEGDLLDPESLKIAFDLHQPDAVMHFAALSQVGESMTNPAIYWRNNVAGSNNLLDAAANAGCSNFIFSSTCATYGEQDNVVLNESSAQKPINAYGKSKRAIEEMLVDYEAAHGMKHVIFRYFNVAGADPDSEIGECHNPETHLVPVILEALLGKRDRISIHGTDYNTEDGTCIRDYVHVCDLVDAHIAGLTWLLEGKESRAFNLGTGHGFSVRQLIEACGAVTNRAVPFSEGPRRAGDCTKLVSGSERAKKELNWLPNRSNMPQMIRDAWRWHNTAAYSK